MRDYVDIKYSLIPPLNRSASRVVAVAAPGGGKGGQGGARGGKFS